MARITVDLSSKTFNSAINQAKSEGKDLSEYVAQLIKTDENENQSFSQKKSLGKTVSGESILANDNMVLSNGIYYNYRLKYDPNLPFSSPKINKRGSYKIVGVDGNILILKAV